MSEPSPEADEAPHLFTGERRPLDRLARVRPGTVVIMFDGRRVPRVRLPGELLIPSWWPFMGGIEVLPVTTDTVEAAIIVDDVATADGQTIHRLELLVLVRLLDDEEHTGLQHLAEHYGAEMGLFLARGVQTELEMAVRNALRMNDFAEIRRQSLLKVLREAWLPYNVVDDLVEVQGLSIRRVEWSAEVATTEDKGGDGPVERHWVDPYIDDSYVEDADLGGTLASSTEDEQRSGVGG